MRVEAKMFLVLAIFFVPVGFLYGFWSGWQEMVGPFGLFLTAGLSGLIAFYLTVTGRRFDNRRASAGRWSSIRAIWRR